VAPRETVRIHGGCQDLVGEPFDSVDIPVLVCVMAPLKSGVPRLDPGSFLPVFLLVLCAGLLQLLRALLLVARVVSQRPVELLASGFDLRVVPFSSESESTQQPPWRLRLVLLPPGQGRGFGTALGRYERRGSELLPQPLERQRMPVQDGRTQQPGKLLGIVLGHTRTVDSLLGAGCFVRQLLFASLPLGLGLGGLPGLLPLSGLPREFPRVRIVPARHCLPPAQ
jgi:hypothetical protein